MNLVIVQIDLPSNSDLLPLELLSLVLIIQLVRGGVRHLQHVRIAVFADGPSHGVNTGIGIRVGIGKG